MAGRSSPCVFGQLLLVAMGCLLFNVSAQAGCTPSCKSASNKRTAVETGLLPAIVFDDAPEPHWSIAERMRRYRVLGVSIAVIRGGKLAWSAGYGVRKVGADGVVSPQTVFQAASISKPVAATVALDIVRDGFLQLDSGVNAQLHAWKIPASEFGDSDAITLRQLLSHTSGLGGHGFSGYAADATLPSLVQILDGNPPANSPPISLVQAPGAGYNYSGGGYEVMQLLLEEMSGQPFAVLADKRVLQPLKMRHSVFAATLPPRFVEDVATGHDFAGNAVAGGLHRYPELAAAGLWSTPTDLARFAIAVMDARRKKPHTVLASTTASQMLTPVVDGMGLGFGVHGDGDAMFFDHSGSNSGYRTYLVAYPGRGDGVVVMTNGDGGGDLIDEIRRSVARSYGWPDFAPKRVTPVSVTATELDARTGEYAVDGYGFAITIQRNRDTLLLSTPRGSRYTFRKVGLDEFIAVEDASTLNFDPAHPETLHVWGMTAHKLLGE